MPGIIPCGYIGGRQQRCNTDESKWQETNIQQELIGYHGSGSLGIMSVGLHWTLCRY